MGICEGKVAVVTGAGNGVGRGEAIELADQGAKVVVNDLGGDVTGEGADKRAADQVVDVIKSRGGDAMANYDDVSDFNGAKNIIDTAIDAFGRLDVLVNNAGILRDKMLFTMAALGWSPAFDWPRQYTDAWCIVFHVPFRCTRMTASKSASAIVKSILSRRMPALFTSTSRRPKASSAVPMMFWAPLKSETSS